MSELPTFKTARGTTIVAAVPRKPTTKTESERSSPGGIVIAVVAEVGVRAAYLTQRMVVQSKATTRRSTRSNFGGLFFKVKAYVWLGCIDSIGERI